MESLSLRVELKDRNGVGRVVKCVFKRRCGERMELGTVVKEKSRRREGSETVLAGNAEIDEV